MSFQKNYPAINDLIRMMADHFVDSRSGKQNLAITMRRININRSVIIKSVALSISARAGALISARFALIIAAHIGPASTRAVGLIIFFYG